MSDPRVGHVLGRYYATRALLFRDDGAARRAAELLAKETSPAATIDRALVRWIGDTAAIPPRTFDAAEVESWFDSLPPGDLSRTRLAQNLVRGYGRTPEVADSGPGAALLPLGERPKATTRLDWDGSRTPPEQTFPWWTPPREPMSSSGVGASQGIRIELGDGSYFIIPYSDEGLDMCSMVRVDLDGQRTPHRPPDVQKKCFIRWREHLE